MAQQVVTELVIDADTSGADRFESAMGRAGGSAEKSTISVQQLSLAVAGVGVAVAGAIVGLRGFVDYVGSQSQALVDMAEHARLAGISTREFQQTLFAARSAGLTERDFVSGLDKITALRRQEAEGARRLSILCGHGAIMLPHELAHSMVRNPDGQPASPIGVVLDDMVMG